MRVIVTLALMMVVACSERDAQGEEVEQARTQSDDEQAARVEGEIRVEDNGP